MRKQGKTREINKKRNKKQGEQRKTMENKGHWKIEKNMRKGENIGKQAEENREKHRKTRENTGKQENKRKQEKTRGKSGKRKKTVEKRGMWKKLKET